MSSTNKRILYLLQNYTAGTASEKEKTELWDWFGMNEDDGTFQSYIQKLLSEYPAEKKEENIDWERIFSDILAKREENPATVPVYRLNSFRRWGWVAAAAILLIGGSTFFLHKQTNEKPTVATIQRKEDVLPGNNKAILTLANGSKITLDSSTIGILAEQGNTKIVAVDNGKLAYNISSEKSTTISYNTLTTPKGGQHQLVLSDGTKVWLDAASSITYPITFTGEERKVSITGQAYFEVAHNLKMPFRVEVGDQIVEDLGTAFNIDAYSDEGIIKTTLLEGSVKIVLGQKKGKSGVILKPGQQAQNSREVTVNGGKIKIIEDVNMDQVVAWKNGFFKFDQSDIQSVMKQISRWYDVEVIYPEGVPDDKYWGGIPRNVKLSNVFRIMEESGAHFRIEGSKVIVLPDHK